MCASVWNLLSFPYYPEELQSPRLLSASEKPSSDGWEQSISKYILIRLTEMSA